MNLPGLVTGALTLVALEVVTSSPAAANRTAAIPTAAAGLAQRLLDPDVALLPNWHDSSAPLRSDMAEAGVTAPAVPPPNAAQLRRFAGPGRTRLGSFG